MSDIDQRNRLDDEIFTYRATKSGTVLISWQGKPVTILKGKQADRFLTQINGADDRAVQLAMAKATGNFKHGNEREARQTHKFGDSA